MVTGDAAVSGEQLTLVVDDYKGPGTYTTAGDSHYATVGYDTGTAKAEDGVRGSRQVSLAGAQVVVDAVSAAAIDGSFAWAPQAGQEGPTLAGGKFHAVRKD